MMPCNSTADTTGNLSCHRNANNTSTGDLIHLYTNSYMDDYDYLMRMINRIHFNSLKELRHSIRDLFHSKFLKPQMIYFIIPYKLRMMFCKSGYLPKRIRKIRKSK